ncbi:UDP-glucose 4-epimerase GalE [Salinibacterium sp. NG22]|uniref:UDP-glucose 4-epimerase GalE n=1 Tax=Salinibacterium sp. NG22 TaxID=2792040 RepID=UPI0018CDBED9|nr:UDP-glucose 4-epimerase GalE [Salinibacterium sp. NG22]MBH0109429.1 UDP-glucose 4-epimerase GalE [Salinibacterium sp. NG22]
MRVLVTGGAGYIGAHTSRLLAQRGDFVLVIDDLVTGNRERIPGLPVVQFDIASGSASQLADLMREHRIEAVIHFAGQKQVAESVAKPAWYYEQNVGSVAQLLLAMESAGVAKLVFSSSAAVYGDASGAIGESAPTTPINPYGATKLVGEQLITASAQAWPLRAASLRYFNVGGAGAPELGDTQALNLIPICFEQIAAGKPPPIFGNDYDTADGTCIRDYVHVSDVADAHLAVLDALPQAPGNTVLNIGTGVGTSVRAIVDAILAVSGSDLPVEVLDRRAGDPAAVVGVVDGIHQLTGWRARYGVTDIVESAWQSRQYFSAQSHEES